MRKKHLKAALADERALNDSLMSEKDAITAEYYAMKRQRNSLNDENVSLYDANRKLSQKLNEALAANRSLAAEKRRASDLFGKALAQVQPETGPSRPNRKKLTDSEVKDIRQAYQGGMRQKDLASNYGVNPATISRLVRGIYH
jgi:uncharacterized coiled-coil DUF342 family protein